jgi:hypothetical protein
MSLFDKYLAEAMGFDPDIQALGKKEKKGGDDFKETKSGQPTPETPVKIGKYKTFMTNWMKSGGKDKRWTEISKELFSLARPGEEYDKRNDRGWGSTNIASMEQGGWIKQVVKAGKPVWKMTQKTIAEWDEKTQSFSKDAKFLSTRYQSSAMGGKIRRHGKGTDRYEME